MVAPVPGRHRRNWLPLAERAMNLRAYAVLLAACAGAVEIKHHQSPTDVVKPSKKHLATTYMQLAKIKRLQHDAAGAAKYEKMAKEALAHVETQLETDETQFHANLRVPTYENFADDDASYILPPSERMPLFSYKLLDLVSLFCIGLTGMLAVCEIYEATRPARAFVKAHELEDFKEEFDIITYTPKSPLRKFVLSFT